MPPMKYPRARRTETMDVLAGIAFPDPYRWLEADTEEVRAWQRAQAELASRNIRAWSHFDAVKAGVTRFSTARFAALPRHTGGRWFRIAVPVGAIHAQAVVADTPMGVGEVVFDPASERPEAPPFLSWISPSPDGCVLALGLCFDGSENNLMRLVEVATGRLLDAPKQTLMDNWTAGVSWLADSSGFFYTALTGSRLTGGQRAVEDVRKAIFFHRLGEKPPIEPFPVPLEPIVADYSAVTVSRCGRWAVVLHKMMEPRPVAFADLTEPVWRWRPFVTELDGELIGHVIGDRFVAVTYTGAPRGRIVVVPLDSAAPNDPASWEQVVPESDAVIRNITPVGDWLYVSEFVDTYARVRIFGLDGAPAGEVPLPGNGAQAQLPFAMMNVFPVGDPHSFVFGFSTLTQSWASYRHLPGEEGLETLSEPEAVLEGAIIEDHWATSKDGTKVPYHTLRLAHVEANIPQPALIYGYGQGGVPCIPQFPGPMATFVAAGGIFVHGHLRGGGELGRGWWLGAHLATRQNSHDDLYAIAEDLIARGVTKADRLGITGASNGGLLSAVAIMQRPDLWRVCLPRVPLLDLIGACREPYGLSMMKLVYGGDLDNPEIVRRLASYSPQQLVKLGTVYPAVFIDAGDTDPRCPAWHARKFAAALQHAQGGDAPILLHVWENVGHGWATPKAIAIEEAAEWLAFGIRELGLTPQDRSAPR